MGILEGKVAIVTGASKGIGAGIARVFAKEGAKLVLVARGEGVNQLADELNAQGACAYAMRCDVSDEKQCIDLAQLTMDRFGRIDVVDCNAGICVLKGFLEGDDEWRDSHLDINVKGVWNIVKACLPFMIDGGGGSIVITSSVTGDMVADPGEVAYATSKAALVGFTKAIAREFADKSIRANCICPGCIRTPMLESMAGDDIEGALDAVARAIPMGRLGTPEECGKLSAFLASDMASYLTGSQFVIDGGSTIPETVSFGQ